MDDNYIRKSIQDPSADVVAGFAAGVMPTYRGRIKKEAHMNALIDYIKCAPLGSVDCAKTPQGGKKK